MYRKKTKLYNCLDDSIYLINVTLFIHYGLNVLSDHEQFLILHICHPAAGRLKWSKLDLSSNVPDWKSLHSPPHNQGAGLKVIQVITNLMQILRILHKILDQCTVFHDLLCHNWLTIMGQVPIWVSHYGWSVLMTSFTHQRMCICRTDAQTCSKLKFRLYGGKSSLAIAVSWTETLAAPRNVALRLSQFQSWVTLPWIKQEPYSRGGNSAALKNRSEDKEKKQSCLHLYSVFRQIADTLRPNHEALISLWMPSESSRMLKESKSPF